jgi:hypothetical protein
MGEETVTEHGILLAYRADCGRMRVLEILGLHRLADDISQHAQLPAQSPLFIICPNA